MRKNNRLTFGDIAYDILRSHNNGKIGQLRERNSSLTIAPKKDKI